MGKIILLFSCLFISVCLFAQHGFPEGHYCNTEEGWKCKSCKALYGLKNDEKDKVIVIPHRGFWGAPGIPETSLRSVQEAITRKFMFCEIDLIMTKDKKLLLFHDQQVDRCTDAPPTFTNNGGNTDQGNFVRSMNYNTTTINTVPNSLGVEYPTFPALKDLHYKDRLGTVTDQKITTYEEILDYCANKDIVLTLDLKAVKITDQTIRKEYLEAIKLIIEIAKQKKCLHQIAFKPGASGQVTVSEIKDYLTPYGLWDDFSKHTSLILINIVGSAFPLALDKAYLDAWLNLPSLIGVEHIYKSPDDPLMKPRSEFGNKSVVQYTRDKSIRIGVFHPTPTTLEGAANGRGGFYNPKNYGTLDDLRGSMEFLFGVSKNVYPGMVVTDRPDVDMEYLKLFKLLSKYTNSNFTPY